MGAEMGPAGGDRGGSSSEEAGSLIHLRRAGEEGAPATGGAGAPRSRGMTLLLRHPLQHITVYSLPGMDPDWLIGERGNKKGKVPVTYLELLS